MMTEVSPGDWSAARSMRNERFDGRGPCAVGPRGDTCWVRRTEARVAFAGDGKRGGAAAHGNDWRAPHPLARIQTGAQ